MTFDRGLDSARLALKIGLGLAAFLAGLDKFFNILADWPGYLSPMMASHLPGGFYHDGRFATLPVVIRTTTARSHSNSPTARSPT